MYFSLLLCIRKFCCSGKNYCVSEDFVVFWKILLCFRRFRCVETPMKFLPLSPYLNAYSILKLCWENFYLHQTNLKRLFLSICCNQLTNSNYSAYSNRIIPLLWCIYERLSIEIVSRATMAITTLKRKPRHQVFTMSIEASPQRHAFNTQPPSGHGVLA